MEPTTALQVRELRLAAGMNQEELAAKAGITSRTLRRVENNVAGDMSVATLHLIARALGVTTGELFAAPIREHTARAPEVDVFPLQALLQPVPEPSDVLTLDQLSHEAKRARALVMDDDYARAVPALACLVAQVRLAVAAATSEADRRRARHLLLACHDNASIILTLLGREELALAAAAAMDRIAEAASEPLWSAWAEYSRAWPLIRQARFSAAITGASAAAERIQPTWSTKDVPQLAIWADLQLRISAAATRNNEPDLADEALRQAGMAATAMTRDQVVWQRMVGPAAVSRMRIESVVARGEFGRAAQLARQMPRDMPMLPRSRWRHGIDRAHIALEHGKREQALDLCWSVAEAAPTWFPRQPYARQVVGKLAAAHKRKYPERLRRLVKLMEAPV